MYKYVFNTFLLVSASAFAGGHGGGVLASMMSMKNPEIVLMKGEARNGMVSFDYGQLVDNQWQIENITVTIEELEAMTDLHVPLALSLINKKWEVLRQ